MKVKYELYNTVEFLEDPFFIRWIQYRLPDDVVFWQAWMEQQPPNLQEAKNAEAQLKAIFSLERILPTENDAHMVWQQIEASIMKTQRTVRLKPVLRWVAAASILLLIGVGVFLKMRKWDNAPNAKVAAVATQDIAPGGNKATLTLADGSKVILDNQKNGAVSKQGGITVIKLKDGQLSYNTGAGENSQKVSYNTISTPRGGQYQIVLSDGTKVWLNATSSLKFPTAFNGADRNVTLTGEGYFEVAHNATKPFYVHTSQMDIKVLGTHFNVNAYQDEKAIKTTLLEGAVKVVTSTGRSVSLKPGEQATLQIHDGQLQKNDKVNLEQVVAWKHGYFYFNGADIKSVMRQLAKWYNIDVVYQGPQSKETFSGKVYRNMSLQNVLDVLRFSNLDIRLNGRTLILSTQ